MLNHESIKDIVKILEHYKELSDFIEDDVPYSIAEDMRGELYLKSFIDEMINELNNALEVPA